MLPFGRQAPSPWGGLFCAVFYPVFGSCCFQSPCLACSTMWPWSSTLFCLPPQGLPLNSEFCCLLVPPVPGISLTLAFSPSTCGQLPEQWEGVWGWGEKPESTILLARSSLDSFVLSQTRKEFTSWGMACVHHLHRTRVYPFKVWTLCHCAHKPHFLYLFVADEPLNCFPISAIVNYIAC